MPKIDLKILAKFVGHPEIQIFATKNPKDVIGRISQKLAVAESFSCEIIFHKNF